LNRQRDLMGMRERISRGGGGVLRDAGPHGDPLGAVRAVESKLQHAKRRIKLTI
jgi:hypothetical protein